MAFGANQGNLVLLAEQTISESTTITGQLTVPKATEYLFWIKAGTLAAVSNWYLYTNFSFGDGDDYEIDQNTIDDNDEFVIEFLREIDRIKTFSWDDSLGSWSAAELTTTNATFIWEDLIVKFTSAATVGNYTIASRIFVRG